MSAFVGLVDYAGLQWRHDPRRWDVVSALAPDDDYAFEVSVLGQVPRRTDPVTRKVSGVITDEIQEAAKARGFLILAAIPFRNVYVLRRWSPDPGVQQDDVGQESVSRLDSTFDDVS